jgi:phosphatidylglycerophosphate synthase
LLLTGATLGASAVSPRIPAPAAAFALALYTITCALLLRETARHHLTRFGVANTITLARLGLVCFGAGLAAGAPAPFGPLAWPLVLGALVDRALDAVDGPIARRRGEASALGAIFDGEVDALATLVLAALVVRAGAAAWAWPAALTIGAMRYLMLAAALAWPRLRGTVPSSWRAKVICDVNVGALITLLAPITPAAFGPPLVLAALALLVYSFGHDVRYLLARAKIRPE